MKTFLFAALAVCVAGSAQAEVFRSRVNIPTAAEHRGSGGDGRRGGGDRGDRHDDRGRGWNDGYRSRPSVYVSYGTPYYRPYAYDYNYGYGYYAGYPRYTYGSYGYDYGYYAPRATVSTSGTATGIVLGALAGGVIGNNSGSMRHDGLLGAVIGAGVGGVIGSAVDANRSAAIYQQSQQQPTVVSAPAATAAQVAQPATAAPSVNQSATVINNYYGTGPAPMSSANALFGR